MSKILLVEDSEATNFISKIVLKDAGFEDVDEVLNGRDACGYLEKECPDFIFLDIKMPVMGGWEFLDEMQKKGLCKGVKVAMLTSSIRPEDKKKAENYECVVAYLEKPLNKETVEKVRGKLSG